MEKRVALLKDNVVFNIVVAYSAEELAVLFNCEAVEVTDETGQAHIGLGFMDGIFEQPPPSPPYVEPPYVEPVVEEPVIEEPVAEDEVPVI